MIDCCEFREKSSKNSVKKNDLPTLIIDRREQKPLGFKNLPATSGTLYSGDYSVQGLETLFSIERKTCADLVHSVTTGRDRFERELHRLRGFQFKRLLVVGREEDILAGNYYSKANPKAVLHSLYAFESRYSVPVIWTPSPDSAALLVERWAYWFSREVLKRADSLRKALEV
jgi:ERCC4-type nuclease